MKNRCNSSKTPLPQLYHRQVRQRQRQPTNANGSTHPYSAIPVLFATHDPGMTIKHAQPTLPVPRRSVGRRVVSLSGRALPLIDVTPTHRDPRNASVEHAKMAPCCPSCSKMKLVPPRPTPREPNSRNTPVPTFASVKKIARSNTHVPDPSRPGPTLQHYQMSQTPPTTRDANPPAARSA